MKRLALLPLAALLLAGCSTKYIGNTRIEDTEENREILRVVEQYRRAVEDRDVQRILDLTSDKYFEDPGTPYDSSDDYDKAGLQQRLDQAFSKVQDQHLVIDVRKVQLNEDEDRAAVDYRFDYRYRLDLPNANEWREQSDLNRIELAREGEDDKAAWKIISGL